MRSKSITAVVSLLLVAFLATGCNSKKSASSISASSGAVSSSAAAVAASATGTSAGSTAAAASALCPTSNAKTFAKTKFVLHTGLAFGAFHRYLYKPYQAGTFKSGAHGRIKSFVKAGLAALYIKREVRLASIDVQANPTLCKVIATPLKTVGDDISAAVTKLKGGDASGITNIQKTITSTESSASSNGAGITENANAPLK